MQEALAARRGVFLAVLVGAAALVPNNPAVGFYAVPEYVCGWLHDDEDQWQCDTDPVTLAPGAMVPRRVSSPAAPR